MALPKAGKHITFEDVHPADISLRRPRIIKRAGTVWSLADEFQSVWVIPDDDPDRGAVKVRCPGLTQSERGVLPYRIDGPAKVPSSVERT